MELIGVQELIQRIKLNYNDHQMISVSALKDIINTHPKISLENIKAEPYFWEKCPYYEPDMMFDGEDEYDCGECKYKDKSVLEDIKAEIWTATRLNENNDSYIFYDEIEQIIDKHIKENKQ